MFRAEWVIGLFLWSAGLVCAMAAGQESTWSEPETGMVFVAIPKGCFEMGSEAPISPPFDSYWEHAKYAKSANEDEFPRHRVCVDAFWMGQREVSVAEWQKVMGLKGDAQEVATKLLDSTAVSVGKITWDQAQEFVRRLSQRSSHKFRLPTETEWEYACRAGHDADKQVAEGQAWVGVREFTQAVPHPGGQHAANAFGLQDMIGNVWEWTADSYVRGAYAEHPLYNPRVEAETAQRVIRGGSVRTEQSQARCAMRGHYDGGAALHLIGFRVVRERQ